MTQPAIVERSFEVLAHFRCSDPKCGAQGGPSPISTRRPAGGAKR